VVEVGSTAHGTGIAGGEDHDEMGVVIESPTQVLGLDEHGIRTVMLRTQPEGVRSGPGDTDRTLHSLRRFVRMATSGNPSILMAMWAPVLHATEHGRELQTLGEAFVGRHVVPRYRGYMQSQSLRLVNLPGNGRWESAEPGQDTKLAMHAARLGFQCEELLTTGRLALPIEGEPADWLRAVRRGEVAYDDWLVRLQELDARLAVMADDDALPAGPDRDRIERWCVSTHLDWWAASGLTPASGRNGA
jgi:hypothetical protein